MARPYGVARFDDLIQVMISRGFNHRWRFPVTGKSLDPLDAKASLRQIEFRNNTVSVLHLLHQSVVTQKSVVGHFREAYRLKIIVPAAEPIQTSSHGICVPIVGAERTAA